MQAEQLRDWVGEVLIAGHNRKMMLAISMYFKNGCGPPQFIVR